MSIAQDFNEPAPIHFSTVFGRGKTPVLCRSKDLNTPATDEPRYATCSECQSLMTTAQRSQREEQVSRWG